MWDLEQDSEPELNIQNKEGPKKTPHRKSNSSNESDDSENGPLISPTRTPGKIMPSKLEITFGDKASLIVYNNKQVARKTIARKAPEPRGILKPQWNIIENGTFTSYSPHTITLDTNNRKNTAIRKNDLANVTKPITQQQEPAPPAKRIIHMVACKSLREYNNNQEKIKKFWLEEIRQAKLRQQALIPGPSSIPTSTPTGEQNIYNHEKIFELAKNNQSQQQKRRQQKNGKLTPRNNNQNNNSKLKDGKKYTMPHKEQKQENQGKRKQQTKPNEPFLTKSRAAALQQTKIHMEKEQNRSFIKINEDELTKSPTIDVITLISDSTQGSPLKVYTSNNKFDFMATSPDSPVIPPFQSRILTPKIDKTIKKIQQLNATPSSSNSPIVYNTTPRGETKVKECEPTSIKAGQDTEKATTNKTETKQHGREDKPKPNTEQENNEEHQSGIPSTGKSSIADIKQSDFYEEFQDWNSFLSWGECGAPPFGAHD